MARRRRCGLYLSLIHIYIAMFYQSLDAWTLIRRSQVLEFPPHFQPETGYGAVNAGTQDNPYAYIPQRLVYPDSEKTNNEYELTKGIANLDGGQDAMSTKLWFALPDVYKRQEGNTVANFDCFYIC